jgi:hypothetical protein
VRSEIGAGDEPDDKSSRIYNARWTFRRTRVIDAMAQLLRPLRPVLAPGLLEAADTAIARAGEITITDGESNLLQVLEAVSAGLVTAPVLAPVVSTEATEEKKRPRIVRDV